MSERDVVETPIWLSDYEELRQLLSLFIDKLDKGSRLQVRLTEKRLPTLFDYNNPDSRTIWSLIQQLEHEHNVLQIETGKPQPDKEVYDNAMIRFQADAEDQVRHWLNRPKVIPYKTQWQDSVDRHDWHSTTNKLHIRDNPLFCDGMAATAIVKQLKELEISILEPQTLRALSAQNFWGNSKFLDAKEEYVASAFPLNKVQARPLLVNVYLPENFSSVLFVENQDTFLMLASHLAVNSGSPDGLSNIALVYTAGFRGTATRIRDKTCYVLSLLSHGSPNILRRFRRWWEKESAEQTPCYFWGDMDYSGFSILLALRSSFEYMSAWKPGYQCMLRHHNNRVSHTASSANKGSQKDPGKTGCHYADNVLLPALRKEERFIDQEIVRLTELM